LSRSRLFALWVFVGATLLPTAAHAQLEFGAEKPRIFSIQRRPYRLGHEFTLGIGVLPLDAFYVGAVANASYTYHFSDFWSWEIAGGGYSLNFGTGLRSRLFDEFGVEPVRGGGERIKVFANTSMVIKPLFGKLAIFNMDIVYSETYFVAGIGPLLKGEFWRPAANLGVGLRFWSGKALSWRLDIRDYLIFSALIPENSLFFMVSASFNYYNEQEHEEAEWPD
jgi:outer membrane beta-barrel protein